MFVQKDPRSDVYFLSSPLLPILIIGLYLYMIFSLIPKYMKNRTAYKLDRFVIFYNIIQILLNLYLICMCLLRLPSLNWHCTPIDYGDTLQGWTDLRTAHLFFVIKIIDLIDTIIFVLRKKSNQVTFLHVFHHTMMVFCCWIGLVFFAGGHGMYLGLVNGSVHAVMYFYYLLTIWKPEQKKSLWWKRHLTQLQLAQFGFFLVTFGRTLLAPSCGYPKSASAIVFVGSASMVILFGNFYYRAYVQRKKEKF